MSDLEKKNKAQQEAQEPMQADETQKQSGEQDKPQAEPETEKTTEEPENQTGPKKQEPEKQPKKKKKMSKKKKTILLSILAILLVLLTVVGVYAYRIFYRPQDVLAPTAQIRSPYDELIGQADLSMLDKNIINVLIAGVDYAPERETWGGKHAYHADVMIILAIN